MSGGVVYSNSVVPVTGLSSVTFWPLTSVLIFYPWVEYITEQFILIYPLIVYKVLINHSVTMLTIIAIFLDIFCCGLRPVPSFPLFCMGSRYCRVFDAVLCIFHNFIIFCVRVISIYDHVPTCSITESHESKLITIIIVR